MELIGPTTIIAKAKVYTSEGSSGASDSNSYTYEKENGSGGGGGSGGDNGLFVILLISIVILLILICLFAFLMWRKQRTLARVRSKTSDSTGHATGDQKNHENGIIKMHGANHETDL